MIMRVNLVHRYLCQKIATTVMGTVTCAIFKRLPCDSIPQMWWRNCKAKHDHIHWNLSRFRTLWFSKWNATNGPGVASRVRLHGMTHSALQNACAVCVLFLSRRILDHLEHGSYRLDLVLVRRSKYVSFHTYGLSEVNHVAPFSTYRFHLTGLCNYKP